MSFVSHNNSPLSLAQLREWFDACAELPEAERAAWLERNVPDAAQRAELAAMLLADSEADGWLDCGAAAHIQRMADNTTEFAPPDLSGQRFGAFRLQRRLGQGGQAAVYLAQREDADFHQLAAVKLLRRGLHDASEHRQFRREREILARLEHPDIARLIDGGVSAQGVPYLVMEYIDGMTIDAWCREQALDRRARVALFVRVCRAVDAAHRALIVHRDLKPSNVLVTREGAVKVLDFGIARLLDEDADDATATGLRRLTPGYAAPEQERGAPPTPASDVYALGVVLAELLRGERIPRGTPPSLPADAPRDLAAILAKACAEETELRYRDAAELADDAQRWLDGATVLAHPPTLAYRARKFVARHRTLVAGAALIAATLVAATAVSLAQARRAAREAVRANEAAATSKATQDFLVELFENAKGESPRAELPNTRELLDGGLAKLRADNDAPAAVKQRLLGLFVDIERTLGDNDRADALSVEQLDHARTHFGADSREYALAQIDAARVARNRSQWADAEARVREALPIMQRGDADDTDLAYTYAELGSLMTETARYDEAPPWYERASAIFARRCAAGNAQNCRDDITIGASLAVNLGMRGDRAGGYARFQALLPRAEKTLGEHHAMVAELHYSLAAAAGGTGDLDAVVRHAQRAIELASALGETGRNTLTKSRNVLALMEARRGHFAAAVAAYTPLINDKAREFPQGHHDIALYRTNRADSLIELGRFEEARADIDTARSWYEHETPPNPFGVARALEQAAHIALQEGRATAAAEQVDEALRLRRRTPDQRTDWLVDALLQAALIAQQRGDAAAPAALTQEAQKTAGDGKSLNLLQRAQIAAVVAANDRADGEARAKATWDATLAKAKAGDITRCRVALALAALPRAFDLEAECAALVATLPETAPLRRAYAAAMAMATAR